MPQFLTRRAIVVAGVLAVVIAGSAIAYWTAGGSGTGTATVAAAATALTANQTTVLTAMYPGDSAQTIAGNFDNPNSGPMHVATVTVSIASVTKAPAAPAGTCDATDFVLTGAAMAVDAEISPGNGVGAFTGAQIKFNNKAVNQDACKGATLNLAYAIA
jgi:hypothetical protein